MISLNVEFLCILYSNQIIYIYIHITYLHIFTEDEFLSLAESLNSIGIPSVVVPMPNWQVSLVFCFIM